MHALYPDSQEGLKNKKEAPHRGASFLFFTEVFDVLLQLFNEKTHMVAVADGMVRLNGKGEKALAVLLKVFPIVKMGRRNFPSS